MGRRLEWAAFLVLCVGVAAAPLGAFLLLRELPANAWMESRWVGGVYASWAVLIYFSWAFLPPIQAPWPERRRAWGWFLGLELAYPAVSWLSAGDTGQYLAADVVSYASSCVAGGTGVALLVAIGRGRRDPYALAWIPPGLAIAVLLLLLPAVLIERAWWEIGEEGWLRVVGLGAGMTGVIRNLWRMAEGGKGRAGMKRSSSSARYSPGRGPENSM